MGITQINRPKFPVSGYVTDRSARRQYDEVAKQYTDKVTGHQITLQQPDGAKFAVRLDVDRETSRFVVPVPSLGDLFSVVVELRESERYGVSFVVVRELAPEDVAELADALAGEPVKA